MLVDHWLLPRTQTVHDAHVVLCLSREARDLLALYNGLSGLGIEEIGKDRWTVAASKCWVREMITLPQVERLDLHSRHDTALLPNLRGNLLQLRRMRIVDEGRVTRRREEDAVLVTVSVWKVNAM